MVAFRTSGIPSRSIIAFTSLPHTTATFMKYGVPEFSIFEDDCEPLI